MTSPRLSAEQRRALQILADAGQNGATEALMLAHGFRREMLAGLVLAELATVVTRTTRVRRVSVLEFLDLAEAIGFDAARGATTGV